MLKINPLTLLGGTLIVFGVLGPWFTFDIPLKYGGSTYINAMAHFKMSPFTLIINITSVSKETIYIDTGVLQYVSSQFYSTPLSLVGLACIAGVICSSVGEFKSRLKLTLAGAGVAFVSALSFFLFLPVNAFRSLTWSTMWGFHLTILGAGLILLSVGFRLFASKVTKRIWNKSWEYKETE